MEPNSCNVRVICRFRPINEREKAEGERSPRSDTTLDFSEENTIKVQSVTSKDPQVYQFDNVFWNTNTSQREVYEKAAKDTIDDILKGYNGTIFAYGQTGSGKSFSMFGPDISDSDLRGIIPRACSHIFQHIAQDTEGIEFTIKCSFLEIYKEIVRDLFNPKNSNLRVRDTPGRGVWVEGLTEQFVTSEEDVINCIQLGEKFRAVSSTNMNAVSSRSHSLFMLTLIQKLGDGSSKIGRLNLADLAGSEKIGKTGAQGETLEEAKKINQSLSALGNCINSLTKSKRGHVPYRDSKLTHILKESLGGNCKTTLLIACSPHKFNMEETISTLKFGQRAKTIKNKASVNRQKSISELNAIISRLTKEIASLKSYISTLESEIAKAKPEYNIQSTRQEFLEKSLATITATDDDQDNSDDEPIQELHRGPSLLDLLPLPTDTPSQPQQTARQSLSLVGMAVELDKLRQESSVQIQELQEEIQSLLIMEEDQRHQIDVWKDKLNEEQVNMSKIREEYELKIEQMSVAYDKVEYDLGQARMEIELYEINAEGITERSKELNEQVTKLKEVSETQSKEMEKVKVMLQKAERDLVSKDSLLQQQEQKISLLQSTVEEQTQTIHNFTSKTLELELKHKTASDHSLLLEKQLESMASLQSQTQLQLETKTNEKEQLLFSYSSMQSKLESLEQILEAKGQLGDEQLGFMKIQLEKHVTTVEELRKENLSCKAEIVTKNGEIERGNLVRKNVEIQLEKEKEGRMQAENKVIEMTQEMSKVNAEQRQVTMETQEKIRTLEFQLENSHKLQIELDSKLYNLSEVSAEKDKKIDTLQLELNKFQLENSILSSKKQFSDKDIDMKNERILQLELQLKASQDKNAKLNEQNDFNTRNFLSSEQRYKMEIELLKESDKRQLSRKIAHPISAGKRGTFNFFHFSPRQSHGQLKTTLGTPEKEGYLLKQTTGLLKRWDKRWILLKELNLYWFKDQESEETKGVLNIEGGQAVVLNVEKRRYTFAIVVQSKKIVMQASSDGEVKEWIEKINENIVKYGNKVEEDKF